MRGFKSVSAAVALLAFWCGVVLGQPVVEKTDGVLPLRLNETPKPNYGATLPAEVRGRVVLDKDGNGAPDPAEPGLAGVSVSDGFTVVKTDLNGAYRLVPSPLAVFIQVVRPAGHDVIGSWYKPVASTVDFRVRPAAADEEEYTFIQLTDTHVSTDPRSLKGLSRFVEEVNAMVPLPRFVICTGDAVDLDMQLETPESEARQSYSNYTGIMNNLKVPNYIAPGNHEGAGYRLSDYPADDPRRAKALFWEYLGPNFSAFEYGHIHFTCADIFHYMGKKIKISQGLVPQYVAWVKEDMASRGPGSAVVIAAHRSLENFLPNFADLAREDKIVLQMVGDDHIVSYKDQPVPTRTGGALCGTWWDGPCADLSPQGYMIYRVSGTSLDCFYKGLGQRVSVISPAYGSEVKGAVTFRAHVVQPGPGDALFCSVDGTTWKPMKEVARPFYRAVYEAAWDSTSSPDGIVELAVKNAADGETRSCALVIHNRTDSLKAAADASLAFRVGQAPAADIPPAGSVNVLMNDTSIGEIQSGARKGYVFNVPGALLRTVNVLTFRFAKAGDGMTITDPFLTFSGQSYDDPRAAATQKVRSGHWSADVVKVSSFIVGDGIDEGPFALKQNVFRLVIPSEKDASVRNTTKPGP